MQGPSDSPGAGLHPPGADDGLELIEGPILRVIWRHPEGSRVVVQIGGDPESLDPESALPRTVVGQALDVEAGLRLRAFGHWGEHPSHGRQFSAQRIEVSGDLQAVMLVRRLSRCPGISEALARRIVDYFGPDTSSVLAQRPRALEEVPGIGQKLRARLVEWYQSRLGPVSELEDSLSELGAPTRFAAAIYESYGHDGDEWLRTRPYDLSRDLPGWSFPLADRVARRGGLEPDDHQRLSAGLRHVLLSARMDGHAALPEEQLLAKAGRLLSEATEGGPAELRPDLLSAFEESLERRELIRDGAQIYEAELWLAESEFAEQILAMADRARSPWRVPDMPDYLDAGQRAVVEAVAERGVVVLTGGPGTGKSTVVAQLLQLAEHNQATTTLCAPTGRAARRLEETTGHPASTIHRLLELRPDAALEQHGPRPQLPEGLVVIDEASMLDLHLAQALAQSLQLGHRLVLVGDSDQLPSVGPGQVLRDLVSAAQAGAAIHVERLQQVHRQSQGSSIVRAAHSIGAGALPDIDAENTDGQFFSLRCTDPNRARSLILEMVTERIPAAYGLESWRDIQVLSPMHRGACGVAAVNAALQEARQNLGPSLELGGWADGPTRRLEVGDRVLQTKNEHAKGVYNGDIGYVVDLDAHRRIVHVDFDGLLVRFDGREIYSLQLAYAMTVHKAQGSEFPAVIMPLFDEHGSMLQRNLVYTGITRATQLCVVIGHRSALQRAIERGQTRARYGNLMERLKPSAVEADPRVPEPAGTTDSE